MLKKIWQSLVRWFRKLVGHGPSRSRDRLQSVPLPPLDDTDREYLFMQLLEGVAHGWQQPRAIGFFNKIRHRIRKSEWLEWLDRFGQNLLDSPVPNYELAGRMVQLSQLDCGEVGDLAGEYAFKLLNRQAEEFPMEEFLPIMEFSSSDAELLSVDRSFTADNRYIDFPEVPPELLIDDNPPPQQPQRSFQAQATEEDPTIETREITLEEFAAMLHKDPSLVAELAAQFGIETTDPQVIIGAVIAQMQQQVQPISGDLSATAEENAPSPVPVENHREQPTPPPPPSRKLEHKPEDPWVEPSPATEDTVPETAKSIERGI